MVNPEEVDVTPQPDEKETEDAQVSSLNKTDEPILNTDETTDTAKQSVEPGQNIESDKSDTTQQEAMAPDVSIAGTRELPNEPLHDLSIPQLSPVPLSPVLSHVDYQSDMGAPNIELQLPGGSTDLASSNDTQGDVQANDAIPSGMEQTSSVSSTCPPEVEGAETRTNIFDLMAGETHLESRESVKMSKDDPSSGEQSNVLPSLVAPHDITPISVASDDLVASSTVTSDDLVAPSVVAPGDMVPSCADDMAPNILAPDYYEEPSNVAPDDIAASSMAPDDEAPSTEAPDGLVAPSETAPDLAPADLAANDIVQSDSMSTEVAPTDIPASDLGPTAELSDMVPDTTQDLVSSNLTEKDATAEVVGTDLITDELAPSTETEEIAKVPDGGLEEKSVTAEKDVTEEKEEVKIDQEKPRDEIEETVNKSADSSEDVDDIPLNKRGSKRVYTKRKTRKQMEEFEKAREVSTPPREPRRSTRSRTLTRKAAALNESVETDSKESVINENVDELTKDESTEMEPKETEDVLTESQEVEKVVEKMEEPEESKIEMEDPKESGIEMEGPKESGIEMEGPKESGIEMEGPNESGIEVEGPKESGIEVEGPKEHETENVVNESDEAAKVENTPEEVDEQRESGIEEVRKESGETNNVEKDLEEIEAAAEEVGKEIDEAESVQKDVEDSQVPEEPERVVSLDLDVEKEPEEIGEPEQTEPEKAEVEKVVSLDLDEGESSDDDIEAVTYYDSGEESEGEAPADVGSGKADVKNAVKAESEVKFTGDLEENEPVKSESLSSKTEFDVREVGSTAVLESKVKPEHKVESRSRVDSERSKADTSMDDEDIEAVTYFEDDSSSDNENTLEQGSKLVEVELPSQDVIGGQVRGAHIEAGPQAISTPAPQSMSAPVPYPLPTPIASISTPVRSIQVPPALPLETLGTTIPKLPKPTSPTTSPIMEISVKTDANSGYVTIPRTRGARPQREGFVSVPRRRSTDSRTVPDTPKSSIAGRISVDVLPHGTVYMGPEDVKPPRPRKVPVSKPTVRTVVNPATGKIDAMTLGQEHMVRITLLILD